MIDCQEFLAHLRDEGVEFFAGVPDSLLKSICAYIADHVESSRHVIAANEGAAIALATGVHLATGKVPMVYLQNSGLGNMINPLTSLADPEVYSIPLIILIGWRGEPGVPDEPQHQKQGRVMTAMLEAMEIPYAVLPSTAQDAKGMVQDAVASARHRGGPYVLIARKDTFAPYNLAHAAADAQQMTREEAIQVILKSLPQGAALVATTGMTSREVFEARENDGSGHATDFLTVGSMGHASQIALGIALAQPARAVYCLDGDGAALMHMGSLGIAGCSGAGNFKHILINNGAHDSVGGQPTVGFAVDFPAIAAACGYRWVRSTNVAETLEAVLQELGQAPGPALLEIRVNKGARKNLGRPSSSPVDNKAEFMQFLK
jgi:phosphonopyruvate decarboxylase